ncbi:MAG: hypothetical protein KAH68_06855 [Draconibacterium sp.]|nr:hypothetical protein [Draconibacterium sp.]
MKKIFSIAIILIASVTMTFAQVQKEEIDYYQSIFGMEKKIVVANFLELEESNAFWAIYNEYEVERKKLGEQRIKLILDYAEHYVELTDEKTDDLVKKSISLRSGGHALVVKYYKKVKKVSGSKTAAQFYQIENYFTTAIQSELYTEVPLVGELD